MKRDALLQLNIVTKRMLITTGLLLLLANCGGSGSSKPSAAAPPPPDSSSGNATGDSTGNSAGETSGDSSGDTSDGAADDGSSSADIPGFKLAFWPSESMSKPSGDWFFIDTVFSDNMRLADWSYPEIEQISGPSVTIGCTEGHSCQDYVSVPDWQEEQVVVLSATMTHRQDNTSVQATLTINVFPNDREENASFTARQSLDNNPSTWPLLHQDFDNDGEADVIMQRHWLKGSAEGDFSLAKPFGVEGRVTHVFDVDLDGDQDLITWESRDNGWGATPRFDFVSMLHRNNGEQDGEINLSTEQEFEGYWTSTRSVDVNLDGYADVIYGYASSLFVNVNDEGKRFLPPQAVLNSINWWKSDALHYKGGSSDTPTVGVIAVSNEESELVYKSNALSDGPIQTLTLSGRILKFAVFDNDDDGYDDLLVATYSNEQPSSVSLHYLAGSASGFSAAQVLDTAWQTSVIDLARLSARGLRNSVLVAVASRETVSHYQVFVDDHQQLTLSHLYDSELEETAIGDGIDTSVVNVTGAQSADEYVVISSRRRVWDTHMSAFQVKDEQLTDRVIMLDGEYSSDAIPFPSKNGGEIDLLFNRKSFDDFYEESSDNVYVLSDTGRSLSEGQPRLTLERDASQRLSPQCGRPENMAIAPLSFGDFALNCDGAVQVFRFDDEGKSDVLTLMTDSSVFSIEDTNDDGILDIVTAGHVFLADSENNFAAREMTTSPAQEGTDWSDTFAGKFQVLDFDNDGADDVFVLIGNTSLVRYEVDNTNQLQQVDAYTLFAKAEEAAFQNFVHDFQMRKDPVSNEWTLLVTFSQTNRAGFYALAISTELDFANLSTVHIEDDTYGSPIEFTHSNTMTDVDGDGRSEFFVTLDRSDGESYLLFEGMGVKWVQLKHGATFGQHIGMFIDVHADGDLDFVYTDGYGPTLDMEIEENTLH